MTLATSMEKNLLVCPMCKVHLRKENDWFLCPKCRYSYPVDNGIPILTKWYELTGHKRQESDFHSKIAKKADDVHQLMSLRIEYLHNDFLSSLRSLSNDALVLDVCCGSGIDMIKLLGEGYRVVGVDISLGMARTTLAKIKTYQLEDTAIVCVGDAEQLPFDSNQFDAAYICASLHHLENPQEALMEMNRCVKPNGLIIMGSEPNSWQYYLRRIKHSRMGKRILKIFRDDYTLEKGPPGDWKTVGFTRKRIGELVIQSGLELLTIKPCWFLNGFVDLFGIKLPSVGEKLLIFIDECLGKVPKLNNYSWHWNLTAKVKK